MHPTQHTTILNQMGEKIDRAANTCVVITNAASRRSRNPL
jgi:ribosomal protein S20